MSHFNASVFKNAEAFFLLICIWPGQIRTIDKNSRKVTKPQRNRNVLLISLCVIFAPRLCVKYFRLCSPKFAIRKWLKIFLNKKHLIERLIIVIFQQIKMNEVKYLLREHRAVLVVSRGSLLGIITPSDVVYNMDLFLQWIRIWASQRSYQGFIRYDGPFFKFH